MLQDLGSNEVWRIMARFVITMSWKAALRVRGATNKRRGSVKRDM